MTFSLISFLKPLTTAAVRIITAQLNAMAATEILTTGRVFLPDFLSRMNLFAMKISNLRNNMIISDRKSRNYIGRCFHLLTSFHCLFLIFISTELISQPSDERIIPGSERLDLYLPVLQAKKVGIVGNHTSHVGNTHLVDTLIFQWCKCG